MDNDHSPIAFENREMRENFQEAFSTVRGQRCFLRDSICRTKRFIHHQEDDTCSLLYLRLEGDKFVYISDYELASRRKKVSRVLRILNILDGFLKGRDYKEVEINPRDPISRIEIVRAYCYLHFDYFHPDGLPEVLPNLRGILRCSNPGFVSVEVDVGWQELPIDFPLLFDRICYKSFKTRTRAKRRYDTIECNGDNMNPLFEELVIWMEDGHVGEHKYYRGTRAYDANETIREGKRVKSYSIHPRGLGSAFTSTNITLSNDEFDRLFANRESRSFKATKALRELMAGDD